MKSAAVAMLNVDGPVKVLQWEKPYARLYVNVEMSHIYPALLKEMAAAGRYRIADSNNGRVVTFEVPVLNTPILYNREPVNEYIQYTLYMPAYADCKSPSVLTFNTDASLEQRLSY